MVSQVAFCWQICTLFPLHRMAPGEQTPVHIELLQMNGHGALVNCPSVPQVSSKLLVHRVFPGTHIPPH